MVNYVPGRSVSEVYNNWKPYQPDNGWNEDCVHMNQEGQLKDYRCEVEFNFICKKTAPPPVRNCTSTCDISKSISSTFFCILFNDLIDGPSFWAHICLSFTIAFIFAGVHIDRKFFRTDYSYIETVDSFYKIHMIEQTFTDARRMCAVEGASLFYAESDDEADAVIEFWNKTHPSGDWTVFVGLTDIMSEGVFETIDGTYQID